MTNMPQTNTEDLQLFGDNLEDLQLSTQQQGWVQDFDDFTFDTSPPAANLHTADIPYLDSPFDEHLEISKYFGCYSPSGFQDAASHEGGSEEAALPSLPAKDLAAENAILKAMIQATNERVSKLEAVIAAMTAPQAQPDRLPATPRKRRASRVDSVASTPSKRPMPKTPRPIGPIEAMWKPGVTPEQREAIAKSSTSPSASMSSPDTIASHRASASMSKPKKKAASKKAHAPRVLKKAPTPKLRHANELYDVNTASLGPEGKASVLLPLLESIDPFTGRAFSSGAGVEEVQATPATTMTMGSDMTLDDLNALVAWNYSNNDIFNFGQLDHVESMEGVAHHFGTL